MTPFGKNDTFQSIHLIHAYINIYIYTHTYMEAQLFESSVTRPLNIHVESSQRRKKKKKKKKKKKR